MKKIFLTLFFIYIGFNIHAKDKTFYLELNMEVFTIENCGFFVSTVLDERKDTTSVGFAQIGAFNKKVNAKIKGGVENSFYDFISNSLPQQDHLNEIILKVQELKVSEHTGFSTETGEAVLSIDFYTYNQNDELVKVFETTSFVSEQALDVTKGHENRVRLAIIDCLKKFSASSWEENLMSATSTSLNAESDSVKLADDDNTSNQILLNDKNPRFSYHGRSYVSLVELKSVILNSGDEEVVDGFRRYKNTQSIANVLACAGGGLFGYPLGAAITTGEINTDIMLSGLGLFVVALIIQGEANKMAVPVVERFNVQNTATSNYLKLQQQNSFRLGYTFRF